MKSLLKRIFKKIVVTANLSNFLWRYLPNGVYVFNYHRIGDKYQCEFDRNVFSCSAEAFEQQIIEIKSTFTVVNQLQLIEMLANNNLDDDKYALITIDDGYIDCIETILPILKKHHVHASFFITTDLISNNTIPWWDEISFILRNSVGHQYKIPLIDQTYDLEEENIDWQIKHIITQAKSHKELLIHQVLADLRQTFPQACQKLAKSQGNLFMNWADVMTLIDSGMEIGSHTISHRILSQLSPDEQTVELEKSKHLIELETQKEINAIVYPVGVKDSYTPETQAIAQKAGYILGFNNIPGLNRKAINHFDLNRFSIDDERVKEMKLKVLFNL
ncbi:polysaccharide deacetylase family protein [Thalassotalea aquiviva]|uniref:polysaccharide deacetylase family protein n=1 Tax=Thalassotalea aquiviva TaxID=3242415 RepID=UPI003529ED49